MEVLFSSLFSGIIASFVFYILMISIKPKLSVAKEMCIEEKKENTVICTIKVVNLSKSILNNVEYQLIYCEKNPDGSDDVTTIMPIKEKLFYMDQFSKFNKDYAYQISYEIKADYFENSVDWKFDFTISAMHSFSNSIVVKKQVFTKDKIKNGRYESGENMEIISL